jgi:hypothetical protein
MSTTTERLRVAHVIKGELRRDATEDFGTFMCPKVDLDELVWPRSVQGPAFDTPISDILDFLAEVGRALDLDSNELLQEALEQSISCNALEGRIIENTYRAIPAFFDPSVLEFQIEQEIGWGPIDSWAPVAHPHGTNGRVRAFPPRLVHVIAGNTPAVAVATLVRGALTKGVHLLKVPANDLLTAAAILGTMAQVDPKHPTVRSFSAVYWRGGDASIESAILRAQFFDKLVVWGGDAAVRNALRYAAPGFEVVSFDPKVSISFVGREAYESERTLREVAALAATDVSLFNQDACAASRFLYAEGDLEQVDRLCALLAGELPRERLLSSARASPLPSDLRSEIEVLRRLEPHFRVWGTASGEGLVIRSDDPVDFHPTSKTVNVVRVESLSDACAQANVATQTVGVYPPHRSAEIRDTLASMGVQRIAALGHVAHSIEGYPHDGFYPIRRVMRWVLDDAE